MCLVNMKLCWYFKIRKKYLPVFILLGIAVVALRTSVFGFSSLIRDLLIFTPTSNLSATKLDDVLFTVKTTKRNHQRRLDILLATWYNHVSSDQIYFITDDNDPVYQNKTNFHMINTKCNATHERDSLCCKTGAEFDLYLSSPSKRKWWCHMDDDNYVNVDRLMEILNHHHWQDAVYVARRSVPFHKHWKLGKYLFGTGGAGYCITRSLANRMAPLCGNGTFVKACHLIKNSDDCTVGFVITNQLKLNMSESFALHSHIEKLGTLNVSDILQAATISYNYKNTINLPPAKMTFSIQKDRSRLLSLHCWLHPHLDLCKKLADGGTI